MSEALKQATKKTARKATAKKGKAKLKAVPKVELTPEEIAAQKAIAKKERAIKEQKETDAIVRGVKIPKGEINKAIKALNSIEGKNKMLREDWRTVGAMLQKGKDLCVTADGKPHDKAFSAWKKKSGMDIARRIGSGATWLNRVWDELHEWQDECVAARDAFYTENPDGKYSGVDPSATHSPDALVRLAKSDNQAWAYPDGVLPEPKPKAKFDHAKFIEKTVKTIEDEFEGEENAENLEALAASMKAIINKLHDLNSMADKVEETTG